jgi:hypothetical protein
MICAGKFGPKRLEKFIRGVCDWGNYPGIAERVIKNNHPLQIRKAFQGAVACLRKPVPDPVNALAALNQLHGLGQPSFASKHLRFLRPDICPVLDDGRICTASWRYAPSVLGYTYDSHGYRDWVRDCKRISRRLQRLGISNPVKRPSGHWYAADVDAGLWLYLGLTPTQQASLQPPIKKRRNCKISKKRKT